MLQAIKSSRLRYLLLPIWRVIRLWANFHSRGSLPSFLDHQIAELNAKENSTSALSVGASGDLANQIRSKYIGTLTEIDIDPERKPDLVLDVCDMHCFPDEQFDVVFAMEVLEHVREPSAALAEIHRVLRPNGTLILSVPFIFEIHDAPNDFWRFTEYGLRYLLRDFDQIIVTPRTGYFTAGILPLLRLYMSKHLLDMIFGLVILLVALFLWPLIALGNFAIQSESATTGYNVSCLKKHWQ